MNNEIALDLETALTLTRVKKGEGLTLTADQTKTLYSAIWRVEAALADAGVIGADDE